MCSVKYIFCHKWDGVPIISTNSSHWWKLLVNNLTSLQVTKNFTANHISFHFWYTLTWCKHREIMENCAEAPLCSCSLWWISCCLCQISHLHYCDATLSWLIFLGMFQGFKRWSCAFPSTISVDYYHLLIIGLDALCYHQVVCKKVYICQGNYKSRRSVWSELPVGTWHFTLMGDCRLWTSVLWVDCIVMPHLYNMTQWCHMALVNVFR